MHTDIGITIMNRRLLSFASAVVLALAAAPTLAQQPSAAAPSNVSVAALVGCWLHDSRGRIIGSIKSVSPDGRSAVIVLGIYKLDNVRVIEVPAGALYVVDGKATLRGETVEARNTFNSR